MNSIRTIYRKLIPGRFRVLLQRLRSGKPLFPMSPASRQQFHFLTVYYPPVYFPGYLQKIAGFYSVMNLIKKHDIEGSIVECGVGRGLSLFVLGAADAQLGLGRQLYGFDSFQGFPEPGIFDESFRKPKKGDLWSETSAEHVRMHFVDAGLGDFQKAHVVLVPGFFNDTLPHAIEPDTISFLNLDVDLYDSYTICMKILGPRVKGLILYDEYNSPKWPGATRAVNESLPVIAHTLLYSRFLGKYFSLPHALLSSSFGQDIMGALQGEPVVVEKIAA